mgnify:FL=1
MVKQTRDQPTLVKFLADQANRLGGRTALLMAEEEGYRGWSYTQLWSEAGRVAAMLQRRGLRKGDRALLWGPNSPQWVLTFFGCIRAGVVVVPLDLRSGNDFVQRVADKTRPKLAFVSDSAPDRPNTLDVPEIALERLEDELIEGASPDFVDVTGEDLVEIMFTSGTTGTPKGVMLTHTNLVSNLRAIRQCIPGRIDDRLVSILPLSHMYEQMAGLLVPLGAGANVTYQANLQPAALFKTLQDRRATMLLLVPQALDLFMSGIEHEVRRQGREKVWSKMMTVSARLPFWARRILFGQIHRRLGGRLRFIMSGGAALDPALGEKWERLGVRIVQGYGATEASPVISSHSTANPRFDSAGIPLSNMEVRIASDGEIQVRGPNVTQGYWDDSAQTEAAFDDGWYKTGDQGHLDRDGYLHIKGRTKDMISMPNGFNVYPDDIETVLKRHPDVCDVVVVGLPRGSRVDVHAVYLGIDEETAAKADKWANSQLADYQRIRGSSVWPSEDFPRTHTLKIKKTLVIEALAECAEGALSF